jgi:dienelactone hydrolase
MKNQLLGFALAAALHDPAALRRQIEQALFVPQPLPAVAPRNQGSFEVEPVVIADRVTYVTEFGMRVPAIVYHPAAQAGKHPALIIVNGHGGDKYTWYSINAGVLFARAGAVVLTYDPIGEGERNANHKSGTRAHDRYVPPDENGRRMGGLMMTDLRQAVSYLAQRPDVDPARIAAAGYSMGSFVVSLACAVETRLRACAAVAGGDLDGPGGYWDTSNKKMCQAIPYHALSFLGDRPAIIFALNALRGPMLIYNGGTDEVVAIPTHGEAFFPDLRARTAALLGSNGNIFDYGFAPDGGHRPYFMTRPVAEWLNRQLHFPNWQAIAAKETKISDWAGSNHVPMDRLYATEHREGGTMALGANVLYMPREKLNVLPEIDWEKRKSDFVLEAWFAHVRAVEAQAGQETMHDSSKARVR